MEPPFLQLNYALEDIETAVKRFWEKAGTYHLLAFSGEMGAGKTTFIHKLCDYLQVQDAVSSPTFALVNEYHYTDQKKQDNTIYHIDLYRINTVAEAIDAGMEDCIMQSQRENIYCFIEWPEKAKELLSPPYLWINITVNNIKERALTIALIN